MVDFSEMDLKAVASTAKGDSGRERLQLRKGKITPEIAKTISTTLRLSEDEIKYLHITDMADSLIMLHPREIEGTLEAPYHIRKHRGVIIDLERETVVAHGDLLGTSSVSPVLHIKEDRLITRTDIELKGNPSLGSCTFEMYIPHVNLRVIRWAGKTFIASHNTIDTEANNSRWGDHGIPFVQMLKECGLEDVKSLFPEGCNYSPHVHMFDVCHPSLNICSFLKSSPSGFIVSRQTPKAWHTTYSYMEESGVPIGRLPTPEEIGVSDEFKGYGFTYGKKIDSLMDGPGFYNPEFERGSLAPINRFLERGYFDVPGPYGTGESVMVTFHDDLGTMDKHQILSPAFSRRKDCIWKNDYNLYHSCIIHFGVAPLAFENKNSFIAVWPPYPVVTQEILDEAQREGVPAIQIAHFRSLPNEGDQVALKSGVNPYEYMVSKKKAAPLNNLEDALNVIHSNLVYTASPHYVDLVHRSKMRFSVDVRDVISFVQSIKFKIPDDFPMDSNTKGPRSTLETILHNASISAQTSISRGQNTYTASNGKVRHYSTEELMNYYIASIIPKMEGTTIYRLIRTFRLYNHTTSLLITEPGARPKSIVEAEEQEFDQNFPSLHGKEEEITIPVALVKEEGESELNDDIYGSSAPSCSWSSIARKPGTNSWEDTSNTVHTPDWNEVSPVTPPSKPKDEPLPDWLSPVVVAPPQVTLPAPARGRGTLAPRGSGRSRGSSPRGSSSIKPY